VSDDHIPIEELAGPGPGDGPSDRAAEVQAHLAGCEVCRDRAAGLVTTRHRLASLGSVAMPGPVVTRVDSALRAAAVAAGPPAVDATTPGKDATSGRQPTPGPGTVRADRPDAAPDSTVVPLRAGARISISRPTWAAAAASIAILAAVAAVVIGHVHHHTATATDRGSGGVTALHGPLPGSAPAHYTVTATGRDYTPDSLRAAVPGLVAGPAATAPSPAAGSAATSQGVPAAQAVPTALKRFSRSSATLLGCVATVTDQPNAVPLTVDLARWTYGQFRAAPSLFILVRESPSVVDAYVTGPSCSGTDIVRSLQRVQLPG
jgi:hypothetical protein